jgi:hypothetical protein
MNACVEVCMYVCAMMCYLEAGGVSSFMRVPNRRTLTMSEGNF